MLEKNMYQADHPPCLNFVLKTGKQHLWAKCYLDFLGSKHYLPQTLNVLNEFTYS